MKHADLATPVRAVGGRSVDTRGWDTVSVVRLGVMNEAIAAAGTSPDAFSGAPDDGVTVTGDFGDWEISPDSDGPILTFRMPLKNVVVTDDKHPHTYDTAYAMVDVQLRLLPHDPPTANGAQHCLLVTDLRAQKGSKHAAIVTDVGFEGEHRLIDEVYIKIALAAWLDTNLASFTHVFATINIHKQVEDQEPFRWLKPSCVGYAFGYNAADPTQSIMAVLCRTDGRKDTGLPYQVEVEALPEETTVAYLISRQRFLYDMLKGALCRCFQGLTEDDLKTNSTETELSLKHHVDLKDVEYDGKTYDLTLEQLRVTLREVDFSVDLQTATRTFPGIWSICNAYAAYGFGLIVNKSGQKTLGYSETEKMVTNKSQRVSTGIKILEWMLVIIGAIATIVLALVTFGAGSIMPTILAAIIVGAGVGFVSIQIIEAVTEDDGPPLDLLLMNATEAVSWSTGSAFVPTVAGLNGALQIGGTFETPTCDTTETLTPQARFQAPYAAFMEARAQ